MFTNLINRRFIPTYYDVTEPEANFGDAFAYSEKAVQMLGTFSSRPGFDEAAEPEPFGPYEIRAPTYPAGVVIDAQGQRLGTVFWDILPPKVFVRQLKGLMAAYPEHFRPGPAELATARAAENHPEDAARQLEDARLAWTLAQWDRCLGRIEDGLAAQELDPATAAELFYLRGRVLLALDLNPPATAALESALERSPASSELEGDIRTALGRSLLFRGQYAPALKLFEEVIERFPGGRRVGEAHYFAGLTHFRMDELDRARELWREHRTRYPMDRLARRSAASLGPPEAEAAWNQELFSPRGW